MIEVYPLLKRYNENYRRYEEDDPVTYKNLNFRERREVEHLLKTLSIQFGNIIYNTKNCRNIRPVNKYYAEPKIGTFNRKIISKSINTLKEYVPLTPLPKDPGYWMKWLYDNWNDLFNQNIVKKPFYDPYFLTGAYDLGEERIDPDQVFDIINYERSGQDWELDID